MISLQTAIFEKPFRKAFPEFNVQYSQLDRLGGAKCPTCNVRQQRKIIRDITSSLHTTPALSLKWAEFSGNETAARLRQKAPIMCRDFFERAFLFKDVRNFFIEECPVLASEFIADVDKHGYFDPSLGKHYTSLYTKFTEDKDLQERLDKVLVQANIKSKLSYNSPRYAILTKDRGNLGNKINEFCVDKKVISVSLSENSALISFHLIKSG